MSAPRAICLAASLVIAGASVIAGAQAQPRLQDLFERKTTTPPPRETPRPAPREAPRAAPVEAPKAVAPVSPPPNSAPRFTSIYSLQALMDFDTLEQVQYDPATKTLALFGIRTQAGRVAPPLYLDLLATAIEAGEPTLTLTWTPESQREIDAANRDTENFFNIFEPGSRRLNRLGAWLFGTVGGVGAKARAGGDIDDIAGEVNRRGGLSGIFAGKGTIHVPSDIVPLAFKAVPRARPVIEGMPTNSLLAHIALEADVQGKMLIEAPELKGKINGYVPYPEWERVRGESGDTQHMWISNGKFEVRESLDSRTLRFVRTPMQFNINKKVDGKSIPDPVLNAYAQLLTARYDQLAEHFPVLHELREAMKIMAVAQWLKRHGWKVSLPKEGRFSLPMPSEVPGIVHMTANVTVVSGGGLSVKTLMWQTGGVDLRLTPFEWPKTGGIDSYPVVSPVPYVNTELKRVAVTLDKIKVPSPTISMPGWYGMAKAGERALSYVALNTDLLARGRCLPDAMVLLDRVRHHARMLAAYDRMINEAKRDRMVELGELERLTDWGKEKRLEYLNDLYQTLTSLVIGYEKDAGFKPSERLENWDGLRKLLNDTKSALDHYKAVAGGERPSATYKISLVKKVAELGAEAEKMLIFVLTGAAGAKGFLGRFKGFLSPKLDVMKIALKTLDAYNKEWEAEILNDLAARRGPDDKKLRDARKDTIDKLARDTKAYEDYMKNPLACRL